MWQFNGQARPEFAVEPAEHQESVWDYPRPPALVDCSQLVEVKTAGQTIASTTRAKRVLETASPPTIYLPPEDIDFELLIPARGSSFCEWKGGAIYWASTAAPGNPVGWSYPEPSPRFAAIRDWLCFYPARVECYVAGERVKAQEGGFYGGWVTGNIAGPWKGAPGTSHW